MVTPLAEMFPALTEGRYRVTSPQDRDYNCIAWAAGDTHHWWWPSEDSAREYWPAGVPRERTQAAFVAAFALFGYVVCDSEALESGHEKIAVFADEQGRPTHAARQLSSGRWSSKLGKREDIEHELHDLEGALYGLVVLVMNRQVPTVACENT